MQDTMEMRLFVNDKIHAPKFAFMLGGDECKATIRVTLRHRNST